jgi:hypothetical protein
MKSLLRHIVAMFLVGCMPALVPTARGDLNYDFESPLPASFVFNPIGPQSATFEGGVDNGVLRLSNPQVLQGGPNFGAGGVETSQLFGNARVSAILNAAGTSNDFLGLSLHGAASSDDTYAARIEFNTGRLAVAKVVDYVPVFTIQSDSPEQGSQPLLSDLARSYLLQLDVVGNVLDARVFDEPGGHELLHVHYVDDQGLGGPPLPPGFAGVYALRSTGSLNGTFDNLSVVTIPEPATCILAFIGLLAVTSFRQSSHRQPFDNR